MSTKGDPPARLRRLPEVAATVLLSLPLNHSAPLPVVPLCAAALCAMAGVPPERRYLLVGKGQHR
ncbi:hypothetical protein BZL30_4165 [Mycobacterium kansasii]|uniref:Uncharacterized protein n=1 Tax=Mycobacterium kansasii TaxID=1768 RepID=A0A1V3X8E6_MYCKA|nr:hypothetical protein BZL29_5683 [Mycobacterium kansasii]OOK75387.1 hypothetical protein BZL30_4165 [Mycobacterium kansasii]